MKILHLLILSTATFLLAAPASPMSVALNPSISSPAALGTPVIWSAAVTGAAPGTLWYRFRTRYAGVFTTRHPVALPYRTVIDYGPNAAFTWSTIAREGPYEIEVSVRNLASGDTAAVSSLFNLTRLAGTAPALSPTAHPLVFIYSLPECQGRSRVQSTSPEGQVLSTPFQTCDSRFSVNFYVAGMRPNATYTMRHEVDHDGASRVGPPLAVTTASLGIQAPRIVQATGAPPAVGDILLHSILNANSIATDMSGNVVWYVPFPLTLLTRAVSGGTFLGIVEDGSKDPSQQVFREFDLAGNTLAETNAGRVSEQLIAMGVHPINSFHHEAMKLADGRYLVLAGSERILNNVQGPGPVDILGDTVLVLDSNLQVLWAWDAFDHLDPSRAAILGETCTYPAAISCSSFYQAAIANDWLHGNALQLTPDGNILYSVRHQDWIVKIDYRNGAGTGAILWRMGPGGDFQIDSTDPSPWFSHQHDPNFLADNRTLLVFDNGNTRIANAGSGNSRGQVLQVDEQARTVKLAVNTDLGVNSSALGTAEILPDGSYHYDAGFFPDPDAPLNRITQVYELDSSGAIVSSLRVYAQEYRNFRMTDLYTAPSQ